MSESETNGVGIHLFEVFKEKEYIYQGRVQLTDGPIQSDQEDATGNMRKVWVLPLVLVENKNPATFVPKVLLDEAYNKQAKSAEMMGINELAKLARLADSPASSRKTFLNTYTRNPYIAEYTRMRAKGMCELCGESAPFKDKDDRPYLESHHIKWLSRGGYDSVDNTAVLCPNCHKRMHMVDSPKDMQNLIGLRNSFEDLEKSIVASKQ